MNVFTDLIGRILHSAPRDAVILSERRPRGRVVRRDGAARADGTVGRGRGVLPRAFDAAPVQPRARRAAERGEERRGGQADAEAAVRVSVVRRMFVAPVQLSAQPVPDDRLAAKGCARVSERCAVPNPAPSAYESVSRALDARIDALGEALCGLNVAERFAAGKSAGYGRYKF